MGSEVKFRLSGRQMMARGPDSMVGKIAYPARSPSMKSSK